MISNNTNYLEFDTNIDNLEFDTNIDNFDFDEELNDLADSLENVDIIKNNFDSLYALTKLTEYCTNKNEIIEEKPYYKIYYNNNNIIFKNKDELTKFITENSYFRNQYYHFNIQKINHNVIIIMRNIDLIINYLLNFHNNI